MGSSDTNDHDPRWGGDAAGFSAAYDRDRTKAEAELKATTAGPRGQPAADNDAEAKNPDGEWEDPAPMTASRPRRPTVPGPDEAGNSKGGGSIDPQGQQGGTHGGSRAEPPLAPAETGGPLASPDDRKDRSGGLPG